MVAAVIGGVGALIAAGIGAWAVLRARKVADAHIELVDVAIVSVQELAEDERAVLSASGVTNLSDPPITLDIKLSNTGGKTAYAHALSVKVWDILVSRPTPLPFYPPMSATDEENLMLFTRAYQARAYLGELEMELPAIRVPISQALKPGEVDRILLAVDPRPTDPGPWKEDQPLDIEFCRLRVSVVYNKDDVTQSDDVAKSLAKRPHWDSASEIRSRLDPMMETTLWWDSLGGPKVVRAALQEWKEKMDVFFQSYEKRLRLIATLDSDNVNDQAEETALQESIDAIPEMRRAVDRIISTNPLS